MMNCELPPNLFTLLIVMSILCALIFGVLIGMKLRGG